MNHDRSPDSKDQQGAHGEGHGCCSSEGEKGSVGHGTGHGSGHVFGHGKWMMIACLLPLFLIGGAYWWTGGEGVSWTWLLILLCPLAHVFMMRGHKS